MKKAQMSLEMVIGLLILLVVAAVVIRLFLTNINTLPSASDFANSQKLKEFRSKCEISCSQFNSNPTSQVTYCTERLFPYGTSNKISSGPSSQTARELGLTQLRPVCQDGIYCFMATDCSNSDQAPVQWQDCYDIVYNAFYKTYQDDQKAKVKLQEVYSAVYPKSGAGSCNLPANDNWWNDYFAKRMGTAIGTSGNANYNYATATSTKPPGGAIFDIPVPLS